MIHVKTYVRVRYSEVDKMSYVYHGHYVEYLEIGRTECFRSLELPYAQVENQGIMMPVTELNCTYLKAARYDDFLTVNTYLKSLSLGARMHFYYEIYNENSDLLCKATTVLAFVSEANRQAVRCPDFIYQKLKPHFSSVL